MDRKTFSKSALVLALGLSSNHIIAADGYELVEITPTSDYQHHSATGINNSGVIVGIAQNRYNVPIYHEQYLHDLQYTLGISAIEQGQYITQGEVDAQEYTLTNYSNIVARLDVSGGLFSNSTVQKIANESGFTVNAGSVADNMATEVVLLDVIDDELGTYTNSNTETINGINDSGIIIGTASAPFTTSMFDFTVENDDGEEEIQTAKLWSREYTSRATVTINGVTTVIEPELATYGGRSEAFAISNSGYVGGSESIEFFGTAQESIEETCTGETLPVETCQVASQVINLTYVEGPVIWQIDASGNVIDKVNYTIDYEWDEVNYEGLVSDVIAVNDHGAGISNVSVPAVENSSRFVNRGFYLKDGVATVIPFTFDTLESSEAVDINDDGLIIGNFVDLNTGSQYFIYNTESGEITFPETFFGSARSFAGAINNNGVIVGSAEYETTSSSSRRRHAFVYDSTTGVFNDLNEVIECTDEYDIVYANDINDQGQIIASALKTVQQRDAKGEPSYETETTFERDADGNIIVETIKTDFVLDENGEKIPLMEQVVVAVRLDPSDAAGEQTCTERETTDRKGLSMGWISAFLLSGLVAIRRRFL